MIYSILIAAAAVVASRFSPPLATAILWVLLVQCVIWFVAGLVRGERARRLLKKVEDTPLGLEANGAMVNASRDLWSGLIGGGIAVWFLFF